MEGLSGVIISGNTAGNKNVSQQQQLVTGTEEDSNKTNIN